MPDAPTGCSYSNGVATCSFSSWSPPLFDGDFSQSPGKVILEDINGVIPSNCLRGLYNSDNSYSGGGKVNQVILDCGSGNAYEMTLLSDSLSANLNWVKKMSVTDCNNMDIASGAFSYLTGVTILLVTSGSFTSISSTAFSGMTSLTDLTLNAKFPTSGIPSSIFSGLTSLTSLDLSDTSLSSIPSGLFDDLKHLTSLTLSNSGLTTLPTNVLTPLLSLNTLDLSSNSWVCDCDLVWLANFERYHGISGSGTCGSPTTFDGFDITRSVTTLSCTSAENTASNEDLYKYVFGLIAGTALAIILAVIGLVAACYQRNQSKKTLKYFKKQVKTDWSNKRVTPTKNTPVYRVTNDDLTYKYDSNSNTAAWATRTRPLYSP